MSSYYNGTLGQILTQEERIYLKLMEQAAQQDAERKRVDADRLRMENERAAFQRMIAEAVRPVIRQELEAIMATKAVKGKPVTKDGKTRFVPAKPRLAPVLAAGKRHKADRVENGLKDNRKAKSP